MQNRRGPARSSTQLPPRRPQALPQCTTAISPLQRSDATSGSPRRGGSFGPSLQYICPAPVSGSLRATMGEPERAAGRSGIRVELRGRARRRSRPACRCSTASSSGSSRSRASTSRSRWSPAPPRRRWPRQAARSAARSQSRSGDGRGYGSAMMTSSEALASVVLEVSDKPLLVSNVDLTEARIGGLGTDVARRFLERLAEGAGLTLHVRLLNGTDTQHVLEAIFKALGVALAQACEREEEQWPIRPSCAPRRRPRRSRARRTRRRSRTGELRVRLRPARAEAGRQGALGRHDRGADGAGLREPRRDPRGGGHEPRQARQDDGLPPEPRRLPGHELRLRRPRRRPAAGPIDGRGRRSFRPARSSRSKPSLICSARPARMGTCGTSSRSTSAASDLDAYLVGGAVRDELLGLESKDADFLVPGVDTEGLKGALEPHGRVEDLVVASRLVGVRLHPRNTAIRRLAPAGIEFAPPRKEVSTGPGRHDFEIVADPSLPIEDDMRRRDFTVNAMARRLSTGELVDPLGGEEGPRAARAADGVADELRRGPAAARARAPLRVPARLRAGRVDAAADARRGGVRPSRLGRAHRRRTGTRTAWASSRSSCSARSRRTPCGSHATPACSSSCCRSSNARSASTRRAATTIAHRRRAHVRGRSGGGGCRVLARGAARGALPRSRQAVGRVARRRRPAALLREAGLLAEESRAGRRRARDAARSAGSAIRTRCARASRGSSATTCSSIGNGDALRARRFLAKYGDEVAFELVDHKEADYRGKPGADGGPPIEDIEKLDRFRRLLRRERASPHRLADLAVDGNDLIEARLRARAPSSATRSESLLHDVVEDPAVNTRDALLRRARGTAERLLPAVNRVSNCARLGRRRGRTASRSRPASAA